MKYYMAAGRLVGTQAEAKERDKGFEQHDVPDDKEGRMAYINNLLERIDQLQEQTTGEPGGPGAAEEGSTPSLPQPAPPPKPAVDEAEAKRRMVTMLQAMRTDEIEAKILESKSDVFGRYLSAAVCRLGELGREGFTAFIQNRAQRGSDPEAPVTTGRGKHFHLTASDERGLRYLALAQLGQMGLEPIDG